MSDDELPHEGDFDQLNSSLNQGLKSCHSVIANYRALLSNDNEGADNGADEEAPEAGGEYG